MNLPSAKFLTLTARHGRLLLVTACCLAWWTAAGWGQEKPAEPQPDPERDAIVRMLDLAWSGDQSAADAVREYYDSAKSQVNDPARWYYAYGIAQLKLKRYAGASQAFKTAIKSSSQLPISAWKGLIWAELSQRHYEPGLGHLEAFGKSLVPAQNAGNDQEVEAAAVWIGQSLGGLDKIITAPKVRQRLAETEAELQAAWPADLRDEAQSGREYADMLYAELTEDLKKATEQAKSAEEQTKQAKQKQLADKSVEAGKQREELKKSAEDLEKQAKERLEQVDKQLERLERDYGYLQTRAQSVLQSILVVQNQMMLSQATGSGTLAGNSARMQGVQTMLGLYQQEYEMTLIRGNMVAQRAMETAQLREQTMRQVQQASREIGEQDSTLGKWQKRLKDNAQHLEMQPAKGKSPTVREKRAKAKLLSTYLDFDPEWERIHLTEQPEKP